MKLVFLGQTLDQDTEHEIFANPAEYYTEKFDSNGIDPYKFKEHQSNYPEFSEYGFNAKVRFTKEGRYEGAVHTYYNLTEIHNLFGNFEPRPEIAFESDIHGTGGTRYLQDIISVRVTPATKKHRHF